MNVYILSMVLLPPVQLFNYQVPSPITPMYTTVYSPYLLPSIYLDYFTPTTSVHIYNVRHKKLYLSQVSTYFGHVC